MKRQVLVGASLLSGLVLIGSLVWYWLGISERSVWHLVAAAALGLVIVVTALLWEGLAFSLVIPNWHTVIRLLPWNAAGAGVVALLGFTVATSELLVGGYFLVLALLLPGLSSATGGIAWKRAITNYKYWVAVVVWLAVGLYFPYRLIWWVPAAEGLKAQSASAGIRFLFAGLLFVASLLAFANFLRRLDHEPRHS